MTTWTASSTARDRSVVIVLDSSFLIAYHNTSDAHHSAAARAMAHLVAGTWGPARLPEYVLLEVVTVLLARRGRDVAAAVGNTLLDARDVEFVPCSELFLAAWDVFQHEPLVQLSLTDAAVVALARREKPGHVATFDADLRSVTGVVAVP